MNPADTGSSAELRQVRKAAGLFQIPDLSVIEVRGQDAATYLHGRSSNDVRSLPVGRGQLSSFLDRKGYLIAVLTLHRLEEESFILLSERAQTEAIMKELSTYHFREKITYKDISSDFSVQSIQGPGAAAFLGKHSNQPILQDEYAIAKNEIFSDKVIVVKRSLCGDDGYLLLLPADSKCTGLLSAAAAESGIAKCSADTLEVLRIEAGIPVFNKDVSPEHLLPETGLEQYAASYNKGCFQGQEVLARIKTYGAPKRALVGLLFESEPEEKIASDTRFSIAGEDCGIIKSSCFSPTLGQYIAFAYIARDYRVPGRKVELDIEGRKFSASVKFLPFYSAESSKIRARKLYEAALQEFASGSEEKAVSMLREVIEIDPLLADAYESLGVILSRHEQYDEAIALMHRLQTLDPESIMAHTNLSVYYMHLGDKERAEEEKAIAMSIRMSRLAREHALKKQEEQDKKKLIEEAEKRLSMFQQVLEIDPDDFLANNGVGTVYVELDRNEEAIPYLQRALKAKPTHTVAYLALGKALENLLRSEEAAKVYMAGIDVAAKRGDITPMKEMQEKLHALESAEKLKLST